MTGHPSGRSRVPVFDAAAEYELQAKDLLSAAERILSSGRYILGPEVEALERDVANRLGAPHAIACASGTDALWLALRALGIGPGDGVVVPDFTFFATASAVLNAGAIPIFCDVRPDTLTLDPDAVRRILEGTSEPHRRIGIDRSTVKAVLPVHLFGQPADVDELIAIASEHGLSVVEDAAQAFGARFDKTPVGTIGDVGCFSFFPTKNLGGFGDGGMTTTRDPDIAERIRTLRAHGSRRKYAHEVVGTNSRLDAIHAALLRVRLDRLEEALKARQALADAYDRALQKSLVRPPTQASGRTHTFNLYVIRVPGDRNRIAGSLAEKGIETAIHYPSPLHLQDAVAHLGYVPGDLPAGEAACAEVLTLPLYPSMDPRLAEEVGEAVAELAETRR